jgi:hypothetical protein
MPYVFTDVVSIILHMFASSDDIIKIERKTLN